MAPRVQYDWIWNVIQFDLSSDDRRYDKLGE